MRLDLYLVRNGFVESRNKAQEIILKGFVNVDGKAILKPSYDVKEHSIKVVNQLKYVSRAGEKLEAALERFKISVEGKLCLDVGSSTGGFTHCLLNYGAKEVYAVDVGKDQLHRSLKMSKRVISFEGIDIRDFSTNLKFDFVSVDVSFISLKLILPKVYELLTDGGELVSLFKPQFEVGRGNTKKGIVKKEGILQRALEEIVKFARSLGFEFRGLIKSPIKGKKGNQEYLIYFAKSE